jgi:PAS domain S-box-containing protein
MSQRRLEDMSKEELIHEFEKLETAQQREAARGGEADRERLIHDLHVHQVELEMQNRELREAQIHLEESRERYSNLYDFAPVGYCTLDPEGYIQEINLTGAALLGAPRDQLVGKRLPSVAPLKDARPFHANLKRCLVEGERVTSEIRFMQGKRGTRTVQMISDPVRDARHAATACRTILIDVSELKQLEDRLRLLAESGRLLSASLDYTATLHTIVRLAVPALADLCMIDVLSDSGHMERLVVVFADPHKQATLAGTLMDFAPRPGWQTPQAQVVASGEPMMLAEVSDLVRRHLAYNERHADTLHAVDLRSLMVVPLSARGRTFGALTLATAESGRRYSSLDLQLVHELANRAALAADNARLYTEAQRANHQLRIFEAKSSGILSISADAIISIDGAQRITMWNAGAEAIFGYSRAEAIGAPLEMLIPARCRAVHRTHVENFAAGQAIGRKMNDRRGPIFGLRKNGEEFPADAAISKLEVGGERILTAALRDITEQKRTEKEQRFLSELGLLLATTTLDYEETLSKIVHMAVREFADLCIVDLMGDDGQVRRHRVVSRDADQAELCDSLMQVPIDAGRPHLTRSAIASKRPILMERVSPEMVAWLAQSEDHHRLLRAANLQSVIAVPLSAHGKVLGAIALVSATPSRVYDAGDLRLAEELAHRAALSIENAELYRKARRASQARDDVLGVVAHDLRSPLGTILMQASLLKGQGAKPERGPRPPAEAIERAATRMNRLIQDLLDVTSMEAGHLSIEQTRIPAARVIADCVEAQTPLASSAALELRLDVAPNLGEVFADRDRLLQALENLVGNAVKFTSPGGCITIGAAPGDGEVLFWVADTGTGIEAENLPHVFDRFWQARKAGRLGAGLGLPIAKGIIEAHGGRIWVESQVCVGSRFFFTLPLAPPSPSG